MTAIRPLRRSTVIALAACVGLVGIPIASASAGADGRAAIARALDYERARDYRAARVEALNAVRASRGAAAAHLVRARVAIALKDGDDAAEAAAAAASAGASADEVRPLAAHAALLRGEPGRALEILAEGPVRADDAAYGARLRGMAALAAGDLASAAGAFDEAVAIAPRDPATWIEIARFRLANADLIGATDAVDLAIEIDPRNAAALRLRANITRDRNGLIASLAWYERAVAIDPSDVDTLADYAATLGDAGRYRAMLAIARRAHALAPRDPRPMFLQAVLAARASQYPLARSLLERVEAQLGDQPSYMLVRAIVENASGAPNIALGWAERLVERQPDNETARIILADASLTAGDSATAWATMRPLVVDRSADSWHLLLAAQAYAASGQVPQPADLIDQAAAFPGVSATFVRGAGDDARGAGAQAILPRLRSALAEGDLGGSATMARDLVAGAPGVAAAHVIAGDVAMARGDYAGAAADYRRAMAIRADEAAALRLVDAYLKVGDRQAASETLSAFLASSPRSIAANRVAAAFYLDARDWDRGIATLEALRARLGNREALVLSQLGRAYLGKGEDERARDLLRQAYALQPGNAGIASLLGLALSRTGGSAARARDLAVKALLIEPGNATFRRRWEQLVG
ncbi:MAG: tetratricopeptide repeat protein [Sphingomonadales bacterium]|nr:tetratricopeptide repeat protein [Sphingomonadales bacterium]